MFLIKWQRFSGWWNHRNGCKRIIKNDKVAIKLQYYLLKYRQIFSLCKLCDIYVIKKNYNEFVEAAKFEIRVLEYWNAKGEFYDF